MRVSKDDPGAAASRRIRDDRVNGDGCLLRISIVASQVNAVQPVVDMGHEQALSSRIGLREAAGEEIAGRCESVELERPFGTLIAHAFQLVRRAPPYDSNRLRNELSFIHNGVFGQACSAVSGD